jgi:hypothetical protein
VASYQGRTGGCLSVGRSILSEVIARGELDSIAAGLLGRTAAHMLEAFVFTIPALAALTCAVAALGTTFFSAISWGVAGVVAGVFSLGMFIGFGAHAAV